MSTHTVTLSDYELRQQFYGKSKKDIINQYGPPTRETSDGGDGTILIYEDKGSFTTTTYDEYHTYYNTKSNDKYKWFYFDSKGKCTLVKSNCITKDVSEFNFAGPFILFLLTVPPLIALFAIYVL